MILVWIVLLPVIGGVFALAAGARSRVATRSAMLVPLIFDALLLVWLWGKHAGGAGNLGDGWIVEWSAPWIPQFGMRLAFALDGLSLLLSLMTCFAGIAAILMVWNDDRDRPGMHALLFMSAIASILGVFLATDLILFFVFYEVMLLPTFALITLYGGAGKLRAAIRFFLFTQAGGLLMLIAILGLHVAYEHAEGVHTFAYTTLLQTPLTPIVSTVFLLGFFFAFAVKLPLAPFHTWQPQAYASAPNEVSILLSALMAKTAGYGLLRYAIPLFPGAAAQLAPWLMSFAVFTVLYASWMAYGQSDVKRLIAYSSAGHLALIVLGAFSMNDMAARGAIILMVCHGLSVTGLFIVADFVERKTGTRDLAQLGGLWHVAPRLGAIALVFAMATLGLPGLGNFIGEFLVLAGTFKAHPAIATVAVLGTVFSAAYSLRFMQQIFFGAKPDNAEPAEVPSLVLASAGVLIALLIWIGLYPQPLLDAARAAGNAPAPARVVATAAFNAGDQP